MRPETLSLPAPADFLRIAAPVAFENFHPGLPIRKSGCPECAMTFLSSDCRLGALPGSELATFRF